MGAIWSAIKSLGAIAGLLRDLVAWVREIQKKRALDQADETHDRNSADISAAFSVPTDTEKCGQTPGHEPVATVDAANPLPPPPDRVPDSAAGGPGAAPPAPPAVPGGEGRGP